MVPPPVSSLSRIQSLTCPVQHGVTLKLEGPDRLVIEGSLATASGEVARFLRAVHEAALVDGLDRFHLDVVGLSFVNSLAIRQFIDWTNWIKAEPEARRYSLVVWTSRHVTWQTASFTALESLSGGAIHVEIVEDG